MTSQIMTQKGCRQLLSNSINTRQLYKLKYAINEYFNFISKVRILGKSPDINLSSVKADLCLCNV